MFYLQRVFKATRDVYKPYSRVGHIAAEFERLANVLLGRGCGNPALITCPPGSPWTSAFDTTGAAVSFMIAAFGTTEIFTTGASTRLALSIRVARKARR